MSYHHNMCLNRLRIMSGYLVHMLEFELRTSQICCKCGNNYNKHMVTREPQNQDLQCLCFITHIYCSTAPTIHIHKCLKKNKPNLVLKTVNYVSSVVRDVGEVMNLGGCTVSNICCM